MPNRFDQYLADAGIPLRNFDATDPEHIRSYLEHEPWAVHRLALAERHGESVGLAMECLVVVAGPSSQPTLPTDFLASVAQQLDIHQHLKASHPGMHDAYVLSMDYLCAALLGWPLENPLKRGLAAEILEAWQALAHKLVFQRVDNACARCKNSLRDRVIGFDNESNRVGLKWEELAWEICNRLV